MKNFISLFLCFSIIMLPVYVFSESNVDKNSYAKSENSEIIVKKSTSDKIETLSRDKFPSFYHDTNGKFKLGDNFHHSNLSPDEKYIAVSIKGTHDWVGVFDLQTQETKDIEFWYGGDIESFYWSPDSRYLAIEGIPAKGQRVIEVIRVDNQKKFVINDSFSNSSEIDLYKPQWSEDSEKILFSVENPSTTEKMIPKWSINVHNRNLSKIE